MSILYVRGEDGLFYPVSTLKGDPGRTPVKGVDYFTPADVAEIVASVSSKMPPTFAKIEFAEDVEYCPTMEYGSIDLNTGLDVDGTSNIRTVEFLSVPNNTKITVTNDKGYYCRAFEYSESKSLVNVHQFTKSPAELTTQSNTRYIRFRSDLSRVENDLSAVYTVRYVDGNGSIGAETSADVLTLIAGDNVSLTGDTERKKIIVTVPLSTESWTFELEDGSVVTKQVVVK